MAESIVTDSQRAITKSFESSADELVVLTASSPVFSPSLQCAAMLLNVSLRRLILALQEDTRQKLEEMNRASEQTSAKKDGDEMEDIQELKVHYTCTCM